MEDYTNEQQEQQSADRRYNSRQRLSAAALTLGILAVISCMILYISLPLGALAIILALLSRGGKPLAGRARAAIIAGVCAIGLTAGTTGYALYVYQTNPSVHMQVDYIVDYLMDGYLSGESGSLYDLGSDSATAPDGSDGSSDDGSLSNGSSDDSGSYSGPGSQNLPCPSSSSSSDASTGGVFT